jgi:hypothetical protein
MLVGKREKTVLGSHESGTKARGRLPIEVALGAIDKEEEEEEEEDGDDCSAR